MTRKEKELLTKSVCEALPYGLICSVTHHDEDTGEPVELLGEIRGVRSDGCVEFFYLPEHCEEDGAFNIFPIESVKPCLRLMEPSAMTVSEGRAYSRLLDFFCGQATFRMMTDFLNRNHFDHRGLIGKGLAVEAPNGLYSNARYL